MTQNLQFQINAEAFCDIQLNFVMSKWSGPRKILRHRNGFEITNWALWGAKHFGKISVLKRMLTFKHIFTILPLLILFIGEYKIKR